MLAIKFQRIGKKHQAYYRIVIAEKRSRMIAPPVEQVGFYDPSTKNVSLEAVRIRHWLEVGAEPTVSVHNLLVKHGVISGPKIRIKVPAKKIEAVGAEVPREVKEPATAVAEVEAEEGAKA